MKIKLQSLKEAVSHALVVSKQMNIALTVLDSSKDMIVSSMNGSFGVFSHIHDVDWVQDGGIIPMNVEVGANLLHQSISHFTCEELYVEKTPKAIFLHDEDNLECLRLPYADIGAITSLADGSSARYASEVIVKYLPLYIARTAHALGMAGSSGGDLKRMSFYFESDGENIRVTATDGYRISVRFGEIGAVKHSFIIPGMEMKAILPMLDDEGTIIRIPVDSSAQLQIKTKDVTVVMPTVAGTYFDTAGIVAQIEQHVKMEVTLDRVRTISACELAELVDRKVIFTVSNGAVEVSASGTFGEAKKMLPAETAPSLRCRVGFNSRYLIDALKSITSQKVMMKISAPNGVVEIIPAGAKTSGGAIEIVLPVNNKQQ